MSRKWFYNSQAWIKCRNGYMQSQHYVCERCGGIATICHHKTYLNNENVHDPNISLNWDLLEALCHTCHGVEHGGGIIQEGLTFDAQGNIKKVIPPITEANSKA